MFEEASSESCHFISHVGSPGTGTAGPGGREQKLRQRGGDVPSLSPWCLGRGRALHGCSSSQGTDMLPSAPLPGHVYMTHTRKRVKCCFPECYRLDCVPLDSGVEVLAHSVTAFGERRLRRLLEFHEVIKGDPNLIGWASCLLGRGKDSTGAQRKGYMGQSSRLWPRREAAPETEPCRTLI